MLREEAHKVYGSLTNVRWAYALSKATGEEYAQAMTGLGLRFVTVRYFNVYGPTMDAPGRGRVIAKFLGCLQNGEPLPLVDGGEAIRAFCYVDDAIEATVRLGLGLLIDGGFANGPVNIGCDEPVTMRDLALRMIRLSGQDVGVREVAGTDFFGPGFEEIPVRVPDVSRMRDVTGFEAGIRLDDGLRRTMAHWGLLNEPKTAIPSDIVPAVKIQVRPDDALRDRLTTILWSGRLSNDGPTVRQLEAEAREFLGASEVLATASGTTALELALLAAVTLTGAAVLPAYTFQATVNAVVRRGLEPVFCDIDPATFTLDPVALARILAERKDIRVVVPVTVFGVAPDLAAIRTLCDASHAVLILDNAHGVGSEVNGLRLPPEPLVQTFSLHATKIVPAGEGGLIATNDAGIAAEIRRLRCHGVAANPLESSTGTNAKMAEMAAALALHSLRELPAQLQRRRAYAQRLRAALALYPQTFTPQHLPPGIHTNFQDFGVLCQSRTGGITGIIAAFRTQGVEARRYFWPPLHHLPAWRGKFELPVTDAVAGALVCLPLHGRMDEATLRRVEAAIRAVGKSAAN